jgi:hypothetical protein
MIDSAHMNEEAKRNDRHQDTVMLVFGGQLQDPPHTALYEPHIEQVDHEQFGRPEGRI